MSHRVLAALALLLLWAGACGEPIASPVPGRIRLAGSTTMGPLGADLGSAFSDSSSASVEVTGLGTGYGLQALQAGRADVAMASWLPADLPRQWRATAIARDGIAIVVHPDNAVAGLGLLQLQALFSGRADGWQAVGGSADLGQVQPVSREAGSGTRAAFEALAMDGLEVTPRAVVVASGQAVVDYVAAHPQAVGYVSMDGLSDRVKALEVEGVLPTTEDVADDRYPLSRELWLVTGNPPSSEVADFLALARGPAVRQIVERRFAPMR